MRSLKVSTVVLFFFALILEASASPSLVGRAKAKAKANGGCNQDNINTFQQVVTHKEYFCQWWLSA
jgi:hypothetical protein